MTLRMAVSQCRYVGCEHFPFQYSRPMNVSGTAEGCTTVVWFPVGQNCSVHHDVQTSSGAHPAPYTVGTRVLYFAVKRLWREADHSPPSCAEVMNTWRYISTLPYICIAWCLVKHQEFLSLQYDLTAMESTCVSKWKTGVWYLVLWFCSTR
jgi:hypothetical protein